MQGRIHDSAGNRSSCPCRKALPSVLAKPPSPKAGIIRHMRVSDAPIQSRLTRVNRSLAGNCVGRLYRSSPRRWIGVLINWIDAGTASCAMRILRFSLEAIESGIAAETKGGRLKEPKMVRASRIRKAE